MNLRDAMRADISRVFLNLDEFAEPVRLNGAKLRAVRAPLELEPMPDDDGRPGVACEGVTLCLAEGDAPGEFRPHKEVDFNGGRWVVLDCSREEGMLVLRLYRENA